MDEYAPRKGILRTGSSDHDDRFDSDRYITSSESRVRLGVGESAGIFANSTRRPSPPPIQVGTRVIVANLDESISGGDIAELFEDLGPLISHRIVRPGVAEVVYADSGDAERAVEAYHNRQLDKRPMKVHIARKDDPITPRYRM
jgi:RNA recognition motif-containing protein